MFNGFYTITSPTGEHRTFQVKTQSEDAQFAAGKRIAMMLTGEDNEEDYQGFGFVTESGIVVWKSKRGQGERSFWEKVADVLWSLSEYNTNSPYAKRGFEILLDKRCYRCNRRLTNPMSIETGIGPECAQRM